MAPCWAAVKDRTMATAVKCVDGVEDGCPDGVEDGCWDGLDDGDAVGNGFRVPGIANTRERS